MANFSTTASSIPYTELASQLSAVTTLEPSQTTSTGRIASSFSNDFESTYNFISSLLSMATGSTLTTETGSSSTELSTIAGITSPTNSLSGLSSLNTEHSFTSSSSTSTNTEDQTSTPTIPSSNNAASSSVSTSTSPSLVNSASSSGNTFESSTHHSTTSFTSNYPIVSVSASQELSSSTLAVSSVSTSSANSQDHSTPQSSIAFSNFISHTPAVSTSVDRDSFSSIATVISSRNSPSTTSTRVYSSVRSITSSPTLTSSQSQLQSPTPFKRTYIVTYVVGGLTSTRLTTSTIYPSSPGETAAVDSAVPIPDGNSKNDNHGLSKGGKVAVGVMVPVGFFLLVLLIAFIYYTYRKNHMRRKPEEMFPEKKRIDLDLMRTPSSEFHGHKHSPSQAHNMF